MGDQACGIHCCLCALAGVQLDRVQCCGGELAQRRVAIGSVICQLPVEVGLLLLLFAWIEMKCEWEVGSCY